MKLSVHLWAEPRSPWRSRYHETCPSAPLGGHNSGLACRKGSYLPTHPLPGFLRSWKKTALETLTRLVMAARGKSPGRQDSGSQHPSTHTLSVAPPFPLRGKPWTSHTEDRRLALAETRSLATFHSPDPSSALLGAMT